MNSLSTISLAALEEMLQNTARSVPADFMPIHLFKARRQLSGWTPRGIVAAVGAIALADAQVKGAASDPIYALEHAISEIASARAAR